MKKQAYLPFMIFCSFLVAACAAQAETVTPSAYPVIDTTPIACPATLPTALPMPEFLESVDPSGSITKEEYEQTLTNPIFKGIQITVWADGIDESVLKHNDVDYRITAVSERIQLLVDEKPIPNDIEIIFDGLVDEGPFDFNWPVRLNTGLHQVQLTFDLDTGETVEYQWAFCILP